MRILVPTDFSASARNAFEAAMILSKKISAEIDLFHVAELPTDWPAGPDQESAYQEVYKAIEQTAQIKLQQWNDEANFNQIACQSHLATGNFKTQFGIWLEDNRYDLVIMGSHGASGKEEWLIGSNTQKAIRGVKQPVLVIKENVQDVDWSEVAFVTNLNVNEQKGLAAFLTFVPIFNIQKIHILVIDTMSWFTQPTVVVREALKDFENLVGMVPCETHFYKDYSVQSGIEHFVEEHDIKMLGIARGDKSKLALWLFGSQTEMLINHSEVPVLVLNYE